MNGWPFFELVSLRLHAWLGMKCAAAHRDGVDVAGVSAERLFAGAVPQVPQLGQRVAGSGDESVHVLRQGQGHAVSNVVREDNLLLARLQVPQTAGQQREEGSQAGFINPSSTRRHTCTAGLYEQTHQVVSPEAVTISESLMKRQQDR